MNRPEKTCKICQKKFTPKAGNQKYCSKTCADIAYETITKPRYVNKSKIKYRLEKEKQKRKHTLDDSLKEARERGISYAELQKERTLQEIREGKL